MIKSSTKVQHKSFSYSDFYRQEQCCQKTDSLPTYALCMPRERALKAYQQLSTSRTRIVIHHTNVGLLYIRFFIACMTFEVCGFHEGKVPPPNRSIAQDVVLRSWIIHRVSSCQRWLCQANIWQFTEQWLDLVSRSNYHAIQSLSDTFVKLIIVNRCSIQINSLANDGDRLLKQSVTSRPFQWELHGNATWVVIVGQLDNT